MLGYAGSDPDGWGAALVLAWEGELVPEGLDRLLRCAGKPAWKYKPGDRFHSMEAALAVARGWAREGMGTVVRLNEKKEEVTDE
jgi:hypothetical protein